MTVQGKSSKVTTRVILCPKMLRDPSVVGGTGHSEGYEHVGGQSQVLQQPHLAHWAQPPVYFSVHGVNITLNFNC